MLVDILLALAIIFVCAPTPRWLPIVFAVLALLAAVGLQTGIHIGR